MEELMFLCSVLQKKKERCKTERVQKLSVLRRSFLCAAELTTLH